MPRLLVGILLGWLTCAACADERIVNFASDIAIQPDSSMLVTETIQVRAEGKQIKRGIYRDFPTHYQHPLRGNYDVSFTLLEVLRDGRNEKWHSESRSNGLRIYIGDPKIYLRRGDYTYTLRYRTSRQLGFLDDHDELYWNVTGNGWVFPIEAVSATVTLPGHVDPAQLKAEAYTGPKGARGRDYRSEIDTHGQFHYHTTTNLRPGEGLTIVAGWPKGIIQPPSWQDEITSTLTDNPAALIALLGTLLLLGYYYQIWRRVGIDPAAGTIIPLYEPPKQHSAASLRFVRRMGYDSKTFVTTILNLAVQGFLKISQGPQTGAFLLDQRRDADPASLPTDEATVFRKLFAAGESLLIDPSNHAILSAAQRAQRDALRLQYEKNYFLTNRRWFITGLIISLLIFITAILFTPQTQQRAGGLFMIVWLGGWTVGVVFLARAVIVGWQRVNGVLSVVPALFITLFSLPFFAGEIGGLYALYSFTGLPFVLVTLLITAINILFYEWLKAPTRAGRRLLDQIEGFRLYLDVAEKEELNLRYTSLTIPQLFERYLPYALALDVEQHWSERFAQRLASSPEYAKYSPGWYSGPHWQSALSAGGLAAYTNNLQNSLSNAISSASRAPGSSSGFSGGGGGGSSGGGGGGGGGGGW